jgi:hypothetical protein
MAHRRTTLTSRPQIPANHPPATMFDAGLRRRLTPVIGVDYSFLAIGDWR